MWLGRSAQVFDQDKEDWHTEYAELKGLLDESEYAAARSSTLERPLYQSNRYQGGL